MKKLLVILFLFACLSIQATTYYIHPGGSDTNGDGSTVWPWLTLKHATDTITGANFIGDTIFVDAGTFIEMSSCVLDEEVSLIGVNGSYSIIKAGYTSDTNPTHALIVLVSGAEGTNGNQSISNLKIDGNALTGRYAIYVAGRSNVNIHDCTFVDFLTWGITFNGLISDVDAEPTTYATGNKFYNNTVTNCSIYAGSNGSGGLQIGGQEGMLIHDNIMSQTGRTTGTNGYVIKYWDLGYLKGCKIYENYLERSPYDGSTYDFAVELWNVQGLEMSGNTIINNTDLNIVSKGVYSYGVYFHDNIIGPLTLLVGDVESGIELEVGATDVIISNNYFRNLAQAVYIYIHAGGYAFSNIETSYNIFYNARWGEWMATDNSGTISNVDIWNNVFYSLTMADGIILAAVCAITDVSICNNIIIGATRAPIFAWMSRAGSSIDGLDIKNNIMYGCGNSNDYKETGITASNRVTSDNIKQDPLFISSSDFHLQAGSPAIDAGVDVGLTTDYDGYLIPQGVGYDIGAHEYGAVLPKLLRDANGKLMRANGKLIRQ